MRDRSRSFLEGHVPPRLLDDAVLVASELATNAVLHASGAYSVRVHLDNHGVLVAVTDAGQASPVLGEVHKKDVNGRGLHVVHALSTSWGCDTRFADKTVWALVANGMADAGGDEQPVAWAMEGSPGLAIALEEPVPEPNEPA